MDASTSASRGTKRKRHEPPKEDPAVKLAGKLHHDLKDVHQASKKARTFETQRVVKKLKGLRKKDPASGDIAGLEAELEELKTIDPDAIAHTAFRTRLLKDRHLAGSEVIREAVTRELPLTLGVTTKVHARLLSARALGAAVTAAVDDLRATLLPKPTDADTAVEVDEEGEDVYMDAEEVREDEEDGGDHEDEGEGDEDANVDAAGWESGSVDDEDEEEDGGWESGSVLSDAPPPKKGPAVKATVPAKSAAKSVVAAPAKPTAAKSAAAATSSQFLPSLSVGFVRGGSSDSDLDVDVDADLGGERKNRRGQRARRAIWEKKYGRGANHKKKEAEEVAKGAQIAQAKGAAKWKDGKGKGRWTEAAQVADGGWGGRGAASSSAPKPHAPPSQAPAYTPRPQPSYVPKPGKPQQQEAALHPSWAAKKALKEKLGGGGAIVPSQGKKIVFA